MVLQTHFQECDLGYIYKTQDVLIFFGNKNGTLAEIQKKFSDLQFLKIKQTHSDIFVEASETLVEGDAHWTTKNRTGLLISTADCTPVMIFNKQNRKVAAIHAGWRGVENQITLKTLRSVLDDKTKADDIQIWLGPHILQTSFEVQEDVLQQLLKASYVTDTQKLFTTKVTGFNVDLKKIIESQIHHLNSQISNIHSLLIDTKTDLRFHSFRRDKAASGRNLSFISLL